MVSQDARVTAYELPLSGWVESPLVDPEAAP
jgi:hypothetical protein